VLADDLFAFRHIDLRFCSHASSSSPQKIGLRILRERSIESTPRVQSRQ
jgi:hypothetical protein